MKYFGHDTNALNDVRLEKLMAKHGLGGYGFYFACLELIGQNIKTNKVSCELEHDAESLAYKFRTDLGLIKSYLRTIIDLGLFWEENVKKNTGSVKKIYCFKILQRLDKNVSQNGQFRGILAEFKQSDLYQDYLSTEIVLKQVPNEMKGKEKKRNEMKEKDGKDLKRVQQSEEAEIQRAQKTLLNKKLEHEKQKAKI